MNAYETAQSLGLTGSDDEIVTQLHALGITESEVNRTILMYALNKLGMLQNTTGGTSRDKWSGTLMWMLENVRLTGTAEQKVGLEWWLTHVTDPENLIWDTRQPEHATLFRQLRTTYAGKPGMPSDDNFQALVDLGDGYVIDPELTATDYAAQRATALLSGGQGRN